jgi:hypothetical protein
MARKGIDKSPDTISLFPFFSLVCMVEYAAVKSIPEDLREASVA